MFDNQLTIRDRLEDILESINLIQEWSKRNTRGQLSNLKV